MSELSSINCEIVSLRPTALPEVIRYGDEMLNNKSNHQILTATINYIENTQRFEQVLFSISEGNPFYKITINVLVCFS